MKQAEFSSEINSFEDQIAKEKSLIFNYET